MTTLLAASLVDELVRIMMRVDALVRVVAIILIARSCHVNRIVLHQQVVGAGLEAHALLMARSVAMLAQDTRLKGGGRLL